MSNLNKIIQIIRENMVANAPGTGGALGSNSPNANMQGIDPIINLGTFRRTKSNKIDGRSVKITYKQWLRSMGLLNR
jgi:hypothetical protein